MYKKLGKKGISGSKIIYDNIYTGNKKEVFGRDYEDVEEWDKFDVEDDDSDDTMYENLAEFLRTSVQKTQHHQKKKNESLKDTSNSINPAVFDAINDLNNSS